MNLRLENAVVAWAAGNFLTAKRSASEVRSRHDGSAMWKGWQVVNSTVWMKNGV